MSQVSIREAKNTLSQLIRDAQAGEEVVIANDGTPVARLVPIHRSNRDALLAVIDSLPRREDGRTSDEIEAYIQEQRNSWE